jgi:REP element-mobilizing transposase RayT
VTERRLPHLYVIDQPLFVTFRLFGSLPANRAFPRSKLTSGQAFVAMDRLLDTARSGPMFLKQPEVAQLVLDSIDYGAEISHYQLHAFVIMSNHVHLLLRPHITASKLLCSLKTSTARKANLLLRRTGAPFWQNERYDHLVRNGEEFSRIQRYIDWNPINASLVISPEQYPWSSAGRPERPPEAERLPHFTFPPQ